MAEATPHEGSLSLLDAASLLTDPVEDNPTDEPQADLDAADEAESATESELEESSEEDAAGPADPDDQDALDDDEEQEPLETLEVVIDGKRERVTLDEAARGYQRESDYRRKTMALAEQRKALESQVQNMAIERQQYAQALEMIQTQLSQSDPEPDWERLKIEDPFEYLQQRDAWRERKERVALMRAEQSRLNQRAEAENRANLERELATQMANLVERLPTWQNPETADRERQALSDYAQSIGFSEEEVNSVIDARAVELLHKAWQYDTLMQKGAEAKRVKRAPPTAKSGQPGSRQARASRQSQAAFDRLSKSGKIDDAVDFLMSQS